MTGGTWAGESIRDIKIAADRLAVEVLETLWSAAVFPVDPVAIASKLGIKVVEVDLPENVSGALIKERGKDPEIFIHVTDSRQRKRFSCAHELGHYFSRLKNLEGSGSYEYVDFRDTNSTTGRDPEEVFANGFAANLLMPEAEVRRKFKKASATAAIKLLTHFDVSESALTYRLRNLGLHGDVG